MIGGIVTDTREVNGVMEIDVVEDRGKDSHLVTTSIIAASKCIQDGDSIFWNDKNLFWSPRTRVWHDYKLDKLSWKKNEKVIPKELNEVKK